MDINGKNLIGYSETSGSGEEIRGVNPASGETLEPPFAGASEGEIDRALELATGAHRAMKSISREQRARFLEAIADGIEALGDPLLERANAEMSLGFWMRTEPKGAAQRLGLQGPGGEAPRQQR